MTHRLLTAGIVAGLMLGSTAVVQAQSAPTPTPPPTALSTPGTPTLFHDDFVTRVDRWRIFSLGDKASIDYNVLDGDLQVIAAAPNYALWSIPDSDLALDQVTISVQADWLSGAADAQFGLIFDYRNDNDMLVATISRVGQIRIGHYGYGVWKDIAPPQNLILPGSADNQTNPPNDADQPFTMKVSITGTGAGRQVVISVNDQPAPPVALAAFKAGGFGLFAQNGTSGTINVALHNYQINTVNKTP